MSSPIHRRTLLAGALLAFPATMSAAAALSPRQYYTGWHRHPQHYCYYRTYQYQSAPATPYRIDYVVYYPQRPRYVYYYNPRTRVYWGRCEARDHGGKYSLLAPDDRKQNLADIPESAFPEPKAPPSIPGSQDAIRMDLPPNDLPANESLESEVAIDRSPPSDLPAREKSS